VSVPRHRHEVPRGLGDDELTRRDMSYSPSSERETEALQGGQESSPATRDVDSAHIGNLPGTGGPDDSGDFLEDDGAAGSSDAEPAGEPPQKTEERG
jgi:hypothetical protein